MVSSTEEDLTNDTLGLLKRWQTNCRRSQIANYAAASRFSKRHYCLGIPAIALSAAVGTSVFGTLEKSIDPGIQIFVGIISVVSVILVSLQTFLRPGEIAAKFKSTAVEYGVIKREID